MFVLCAALKKLRNCAAFWERWQFHPNTDIDYYPSRFKVRPEFLRPNVIVVCRDGMQEAMLIGRLDQLPMEFKLGFWRWSRGEMRVLSFPFAGLLGNGSPENVRMIVGEIIRSLREQEADTASFVNLRVGSPLYEAVTQIPGLISRDQYPIAYPHFTMALPEDQNEWYRTMTHKSRHKVKRWATRLRAEGESFDIKCFRFESDLESMIPDVEAVAHKTYQRGLGVGFMDNEEVRQRLWLAARKGWLRTYILYVGGKPSAFLVAAVYRGTMHVDFVGYDPKYERYSPGAFLITNVLEGNCGGEVKEVDFAYGEEDYKHHFSTKQWSEATVRIFRPSVKGLVLNLVSTLSVFVDRFVKGGLQQIGLLSRLKKAWRRHVTDGEPASLWTKKPTSDTSNEDEPPRAC